MENDIEVLEWHAAGVDAESLPLRFNDGWFSWEQVIEEARGEDGVVEWVRATKTADLTRKLEVAREALEEAPLRGLTEVDRDFDARQDAWLRDHYNPALKEISDE